MQHELASPFIPFLVITGGGVGGEGEGIYRTIKMHKQIDPLPLLPRERNYADLGL